MYVYFEPYEQINSRTSLVRKICEIQEPNTNDDANPSNSTRHLPRLKFDNYMKKPIRMFGEFEEKKLVCLIWIGETTQDNQELKKRFYQFIISIQAYNLGIKGLKSLQWFKNKTKHKNLAKY